MTSHQNAHVPCRGNREGTWDVVEFLGSLSKYYDLMYTSTHVSTLSYLPHSNSGHFPWEIL